MKWGRDNLPKEGGCWETTTSMKITKLFISRLLLLGYSALIFNIKATCYILSIERNLGGHISSKVSWNDPVMLTGMALFS